MLLPRLITALIGIPLVVTTIYFGSIPYLLLVMGVTVLALREFYALLAQARYDTPQVTGPLYGGILVFSLYWNGTELGTLTGNQGTSFVLTVLVLLLFLQEVFRPQSKAEFVRAIYGTAGLILVAWTLGHLVVLRDLRPLGREYTFFLFLLLWSVDIGAFVVGRVYGQRKLAAHISPKKTVEGALGAMLVAVIVSVALWKFLLRGIWQLPETIFIGCILAVVAQCSDLLESLFKRTMKVKDSSALLPGHGGFLDRFDSFIFAAPIFYYYVIIFHN